MVTIKLRLISNDLARDPDHFDVLRRQNDRARAIAQEHERAGPFCCEVHPDHEGAMIVVTAIPGSRVRVSKQKFCCQAFADLVDARMAVARV